MTQTTLLPKHIAIIMDGNGRWAKKRHLPRVAGHKMGVDTIRRIVRACSDKGVEVLTLFAFSTENWLRPEQEVSYLMSLFVKALRKEVNELHKEKVRLKFIGDRSRFGEELKQTIQDTETATAMNTGLTLLIAANYGGRWELVEATRRIAAACQAGQLTESDISAELMQQYLAFAEYPDPDLLIRTSGELRISNFMLWQLAYAELYFTDVLWPDFSVEDLEKALNFFENRDRRFGRTEKS